ncbi:MAG TPA: hypothetical protein VE974_04645 [Thermoanaerobaculia bacterium]|nr:hypothetical protein [Thermoanaerobaculia bacterium]
MNESLTRPDTLQAAVVSSMRGWTGYLPIMDVLRSVPGVNAYVTGGTVRDAVAGSGRPPKDFDFFLDGAGAERFLDALGQEGELTTGPFGSPRWLPRGERQRYADIVPVWKFRTGLWRCENIVDVLNQFDFTANAVAVDIRDGTVFDPQNGLRDGRAGIMRAVRFDFPEEPIRPGEELSFLSVLWFRLAHYAAALDFSIEPLTVRWLREHERFRADVDAFRRTFYDPDLTRVHLNEPPA